MPILAYLFFFIALTVSASAATLDEKIPTFPVKKATQQLDRINLNLSLQSLDVSNLSAAIKTISGLSSQSDDCVQDAQKKLTAIDTLIQQGLNSTTTDKQGADSLYLDNEKQKLANKQAQCRLFSIRSKEALDAYKTALDGIKKQQTLTRGSPLWSLIPQLANFTSWFGLPDGLSFGLPDTLHSPWYWVLMISTSMILAGGLLKLLSQSLSVGHYLLIKKWQWSTFLIVSAWLFSAILQTYWVLFSEEDGLIIVTKFIFWYFSGLCLLVFFFKLNKVRLTFYWYSLNIRLFERIGLYALTIYSATKLSKVLLSKLDANQLLTQLATSLLLVLVLLLSNYSIHAFCRQNLRLPFIKKHQALIKNMANLCVIGLILLDFSGYHVLAFRLSLSAITSIIIVFFSITSWHGISKAYLALNEQAVSKQFVIHYFGYKSNEAWTEFLILRSTLQLSVLLLSGFLIIKSWGFADYYLDTLYSDFFNGFPLGNTTVYPAKIILGILAYSILYLVFRSLSTHVSRLQQFDGEEETQVAVASILSYLGFSVALIASLLIAGFNFTGLAIIAGALSVGIGLGLQSIVNNFVSGLILLIEKPIKTGDRINVDGVEGFVKKIRVRSTHILTPAREDVIVPNSDLITRRVVNYMYTDKYCRIQCDVAVAYASDITLVREILSKVANQHDEVVKTGTNKPLVLFSAFGENALKFNLLCTIKDVNKKAVVQSELNFAIVEHFRQHQIEIGIPQRDVYVRTYSENSNEP